KHEDRDQEPAFLSEVYDAADVTRVVLVWTGHQGETGVVEEAYLATAKRSYAANRSRALGLAVHWPRRACERLAAGTGWRRPASGPVAGLPPLAERRRSLTRFLLAIAARRVGLAWTRLFRHPQWNVGVLRLPVATLVRTGYRADDVAWCPQRGSRSFLADPFGIARDGVVSILCERYSYTDSKGHIAALDYSHEGFVERDRPAIELASHMSYPSLVEGADGIYCIPETSDEGEVRALRATRFPEEWSKAAVLLPGFPGVDPTVFRHDDRWWLTATRKG